jgi:hypothetical protein
MAIVIVENMEMKINNELVPMEEALDPKVCPICNIEDWDGLIN